MVEPRFSEKSPTISVIDTYANGVIISTEYDIDDLDLEVNGAWLEPGNTLQEIGRYIKRAAAQEYDGKPAYQSTEFFYVQDNTFIKIVNGDDGLTARVTRPLNQEEIDRLVQIITSSD